MEIKSKLDQWIQGANTWLSEQVWFQQIREKWEELDPQVRSALKTTASATVALIFGLWVLSLGWHASKLQRELETKSDLVVLMKNAQDELSKMDEIPQDSPSTSDWNQYIRNSAQKASVDTTNVQINPTPSSGSKNPLVDENLLDIDVKKISIRQATRLLYYLEEGPAKIRNVKMETDGAEGYLNLKIAFSGFTLKANP